MAEPGTITIVQFARLAELTERRLRDLTSEGWLPKPVSGAYPLAKSIQGLLRYYREREKRRAIQDDYDSIASFAAATGIPVTTLKHAKRNGCPGFRGSRVYVIPLLRWLHGPGNGTTVNYDQERAHHLTLQNAKLQVELRKMRREVVPTEEARRIGTELGNAIRKVVTHLHRLAPSIVGHPVDVVETRLKEQEDEILKQLHLLHENLSRWEEPT